MVAQINYDYIGQMIAYEEGRLDNNETVRLFQYLIDTGKAWGLQGHYGRTATDLIEQGLCHAVMATAQRE